ncbi:helix-turn-helix domain-containing protein [Bifidobacterium miconisargentati]|uniref:helix-turn-helix domain-containing protein n=1 Tax=Bifidobacterium miconisargentati TaxID=2834437 RepID=UPI001BDDAAF4|nr:helix-turn-helix transcriptional regulator [Bifidobacterium miconisargentati]MBW3091073.1 helix-turn-helix transcriptional regulator [Bifidobacterium miconisargentati]
MSRARGVDGSDEPEGEGGGRIVLRLDRIMVERGRSLNWLADRVGITNVNLSKIKNNRVSAIRFSTLAAICEALDCQPGDILEYVRD